MAVVEVTFPFTGPVSTCIARHAYQDPQRQPTIAVVGCGTHDALCGAGRSGLSEFRLATAGRGFALRAAHAKTGGVLHVNM